MRISDCSSDVCSSDLRCRTGRIGDAFAIGMRDSAGSPDLLDDVSGRTGITHDACGIAAAVVHHDHRPFSRHKQHGRSSSWDRVLKDLCLLVGARFLKNKTKITIISYTLLLIVL